MMSFLIFNVFFILMFFFSILMFQLIHNHQIEALNERVTVKQLLPAEPSVRAECYPRLIQ